ncbi:MAG: DUF1192 family protein [Alphaproteobacteria bacterium]|nr:DUF1192 family protein [Alphaproteobacteria bacterium]
MDFEDEDLVPKTAKPKPKNLEPMGVEELKAYVAELEEEIARAQQAIAAKQRVSSDAERFFKK